MNLLGSKNGNSTNQKFNERALLLAAFVLACFAFSPATQAQLPSPTPDGFYPNGNTAEGIGALHSLTTGSSNTAVGSGALEDNDTGSGNTATGANALTLNTGGQDNTATGDEALFHNTTGRFNTANGAFALFDNTTGLQNTANGVNALLHNTTGKYNTTDGNNALYSNTTGSSNIGIGVNAGRALTTGSGNVCIGVNVFGVAGESNTTRIRNVYSSAVSGLAVYVDSGGKLGHLSSSRRYKDEIKPMDKASETILALKPVTFRYKKEIDANGTKQFGLVAEEVEKVNPDLVTRDKAGKSETVRYEAINAMLLNEFLKERKAFLEEHRTVQDLKAIVAQQQKQIEALTSGLAKVSAQVLEVSKTAPQLAQNN